MASATCNGKTRKVLPRNVCRQLGLYATTGTSLLNGAAVWNRIDDAIRWAIRELRGICPAADLGTRTLVQHLLRAGTLSIMFFRAPGFSIDLLLDAKGVNLLRSSVAVPKRLFRAIIECIRGLRLPETLSG